MAVRVTSVPGAGESRDRAGWRQQLPGAGAGRTWGAPGEQRQGSGSLGWDFSEVAGGFGCCSLSFPSLSQAGIRVSHPPPICITTNFPKKLFLLLLFCFFGQNILFLVSVQRGFFSPKFD